ncbi:MAG: DUF853 family protein [Clostridiales bacterium]|nr:DUF853 family protein [Clostridiales bacterium]
MEYIFCPECGTQLTPNAKFCVQCGEKIIYAPPAAADGAVASVAADGVPADDAPSLGATSGGRPMRGGDKIWIGTGKEPVYLIPRMLNRHGLVAGATGTGKTTTTKALAEAFSDMGIPVFMADIKGDVSGMCQAGKPGTYVDQRVKDMEISDFRFESYPVRVFDVYGKNGIPVRTTISDMGPILLARILGLNDTQAGILQIVFKIADDRGLLLIDLKDLRAMLKYVGDNARELTTAYGNITAQSVGAIQRGLLTLEASGGEAFFGEPALDMADWLALDDRGRGYINLLDCAALFQNPLLYTTFLLWMLSTLYEMMPEVGDLDKPKMIFFFDEAHLLFNGAPKALLQIIEQVVRLIRSKGVGIYFITQSPADIPDTVLSQLGNKIQHALRAYTPKDQKAMKAAAASYRQNPDFHSETVLGELATGEALISALDKSGAPEIVQRAFILPIRSYPGVADAERVSEMTRTCPLYAKYRQAFDRDSAYEALQREQAQEEALKQQQAAMQPQAKQTQARQAQAKRAGSSPLDKAVSSAMTQIGREAGRSLARGLFGNRK